MQIILPARPDARRTKVFRLDSNEWIKVYERSVEFIDHIYIYNTGGQPIYSSDHQNPIGDNFQQIGPGTLHTEDTDPKELWLRRSSADTIPVVRITFVYFSAEQIERLKNMKQKFEG